MLVSTAALLMTVLPFLQKDTRIKEGASGWVFFWAILGVITGILAPAIYYPAGDAWSSLMATVSAICAAFVTVFLVQGLRKPAGSKDRTL